MVSFDEEKYLKNKPPPPPQGLDKLSVTARCEFVLMSNLKQACGSVGLVGLKGLLGLSVSRIWRGSGCVGIVVKYRGQRGGVVWRGRGKRPEYIY